MPTKREGMSKKLRFEVMKRDGFTCRYCGANAMTTVLEVDHVVAVASGGTNAAENLVTACRSCNAGKSDVPLDRSKLASPTPTSQLKEQTAQVRAYLAACRELQEAKNSVIQEVVNHWCERVDHRGMPKQLANSTSYWISTIGLARVLEAVEVTGGRSLAGNVEKYFIAVMRNMRDRGELGAAQ